MTTAPARQPALPVLQARSPRASLAMGDKVVVYPPVALADGKRMKVRTP